MSRALQLLLAIICLCSWRPCEIVARTINPPSNGNISIRPSAGVNGTVATHTATASSQKTHDPQNLASLLQPLAVPSRIPFPQDASAFQSQWFPQEPESGLKVPEPTVMMSSNFQTPPFGRRLKRQQTTTTEKPPTVLQQYFQNNPDGTYEQRWVQPRMINLFGSLFFITSRLNAYFLYIFPMHCCLLAFWLQLHPEQWSSPIRTLLLVWNGQESIPWATWLLLVSAFQRPLLHLLLHGRRKGISRRPK